jgi:hypothetical protein
MPGRKPQIPAEKIDEIVRLTREPRPEGETRWSCRPFVWTATAEEILEKVSRGRVALASIPAPHAGSPAS